MVVNQFSQKLLTKENAKVFIEYVNKYGYFRDGRYCVDFGGKTYDVAGMVKMIKLMNLA